MNKKQTIKKLQKEAAEIRARINEIEEEEIEKIQKPRLKECVGKCFAYRRNCYSCPKNESDYWDVFRKVLEWVDTKERGFHFICEEFYIDRDGKIVFIIDDQLPYLNKEWWGKNPFHGFEEITKDEYERERAKTLAEMKSRTKLKRALSEKYR